MLSKVHKSRGEFLINSITPHSFFLGVLPPVTKQTARTTGCVHGPVGWSHHLGDLEGLLGSQNPSVCWDHTGGMRGGCHRLKVQFRYWESPTGGCTCGKSEGR